MTDQGPQRQPTDNFFITGVDQSRRSAKEIHNDASYVTTIQGGSGPEEKVEEGAAIQNEVQHAATTLIMSDEQKTQEE